jgi:uncharacterized protein (AIM24 family)
VEHRTLGTTLPILEMTLQPGEAVVAEPGRLGWMSPNFSMVTNTSGTQGQSGGGIMSGLKRMVAGNNLFSTTFQAVNSPGLIAFSTRMPGTILPIQVSPGQGYFVHRHGFLCATPGVELGLGLTSTRGTPAIGRRRGGFVMTTVRGSADVWVDLSGEIVRYDLKPGETMLAHHGHVGMFSESVTYEWQQIRGFANFMASQDGGWLMALTGPGSVWMMSLTIEQLAEDIEPYLPQPG